MKVTRGSEAGRERGAPINFWAPWGLQMQMYAMTGGFFWGRIPAASALWGREVRNTAVYQPGPAGAGTGAWGNIAALALQRSQLLRRS